MASSKRGTILTILAILFVLAAIEDILKPFHLEGPATGLVFFGARLSGISNAIMGPLLGIFLLIYAAGIWRMKGYALYLAYVYAIYVTINLATRGRHDLLFIVRHPTPASRGQLIFGIIYTILALTFTWGAVVILNRRKAELT